MYLLDANIFIEANKRYYQKSIVPSFWKFIVEHKDIYTLQAVKDEIKNGKDDLFISIDKVKTIPLNIEFAPDITKYIQGKYKNSPNTTTFLDSADFQLICTSKKFNYKLITHEKYSNSTKKIKIPNICKDFNIKYLDTFELLIELNISLGNNYTLK